MKGIWGLGGGEGGQVQEVYPLNLSTVLCLWVGDTGSLCGAKTGTSLRSLRLPGAHQVLL